MNELVLLEFKLKVREMVLDCIYNYFTAEEAMMYIRGFFPDQDVYILMYWIDEFYTEFAPPEFNQQVE